MIAIGGCDYCGEFCSPLAAGQPDDFEFNGWVPPSAIERHRALVGRRMDCAFEDDGEFSPGRHVGPYHDRRGRRLDTCPHCSSRSSMDGGWWNSRLTHARCLDCWSTIAGAGVLRRRRRSPSLAAAAPGEDLLPEGTLDAASSTAPTDRARVEAAFRAYLGSGRLRIRWASSPGDVVRALRDAIATSPVALDPSPGDGVAPWSIWATPASVDPTELDEDEGEDETAPDSGETAVARIVGPLAASFDDRLAPAVLTDAGQFAVRSRISADRELVRLADVLRTSAGPVVVLRDEIVVCERPLLVRLDEGGRPHADAGPAIAYPDGFALWAWHGVAVPEWVISDPARITPDLIDLEPNAELRRVLIERFGIERFIREGGAELLDEDSTGRLWRRSLGRWGESIVVVEVENSTPEPDGSRRTYVLRVPPGTLTARGAVAWTFGLERNEYRPVRET